MSAQPVSILVWRDAKTDPPDGDRITMTDQGDALHDPAGAWRHVELDPYDNPLRMDPQPLWWTDVPDGLPDDPLTLDDLWRVTEYARLALPGILRVRDDVDAAVAVSIGRLEDALQGATL